MSISSNIKSWANTAMILTMGVGVYFYIEDSRRARLWCMNRRFFLCSLVE